jgi:hypothetical protein
MPISRAPLFASRAARMRGAGTTAPPSQTAPGQQQGVGSVASKQAELAMMANKVNKPANPPQGISPSVGPAALTTAKPLKKGGSVGSASKRADGIAQRGKTKGKMI